MYAPPNRLIIAGFLPFRVTDSCRSYPGITYRRIDPYTVFVALVRDPTYITTVFTRIDAITLSA